MSERTDDGDLWQQVTQLLRRRPGWRLEAVATPGALPVWCFGPPGDTDLSVTADGASITVHVMASDDDVELGTVDDLVDWLHAYRPGSLEERTAGVFDRLKRRRGRLFGWE
ncbi:MAG TPA: hypothetical protein VHX40_05085 [Acidimicrobiales bacterium]|nr:hypothetical protein [Acidimicrobiales bacterium]